MESAETLGSDRNHASLTRRVLLGTAASSGLAGCASRDGGSGEPSPVRQTGGSNHDHAGDYLGESDPVGRLAVDRIVGSRREGDTVYYDPDERGPYADGTAALEDVPPGGTFVLARGPYDVPSEGRLVSTDPVHLTGAAAPYHVPDTWGEDYDLRGPRLLNTGDDAIDQPVVELDGTGKRGSDGGSVRGLGILHEGDAPAIRIEEAIRTRLLDNHIHCHNTAPFGIKFVGGAFFTRAHRNTVRNATDTVVYVGGTGYAHEFYSNHFSAKGPESVAFRTEVHRTILVGGECISRNEDGVAVKFGGPRPILGGLVVEPGIEHTPTGVRIGSERTAPVRNIRVENTTVPPGHVDTGIHFDNAIGCQFVSPNTRVPSDDGGQLARWSERAEHCGVIADASVLQDASYTDEGATAPYVTVQGTATDEDLASFPTGVPTNVEYAVDRDGPAFHDGQEWFDVGGGKRTFEP
jgi:hypothetical protein